MSRLPGGEENNGPAKQSVTVAASTGTHFLYDGDAYPRVFHVYPLHKDDARLVSGSFSLEVPLGSTVAGSVPADQNALIDALAAIITPASAGGGGGATASEIGTAVDDALRATPLPVSSGTSTVVMPAGGSAVALPQTETFDSGTARVFTFPAGTDLPRSVFLYVTSGDTITVEYRGSSSDSWITFNAFTADAQLTLTSPVAQMSLQRTSGSGTASKATVL